MTQIAFLVIPRTKDSYARKTYTCWGKVHSALYLFINFRMIVAMISYSFLCSIGRSSIKLEKMPDEKLKYTMKVM